MMAVHTSGASFSSVCHPAVFITRSGYCKQERVETQFCDGFPHVSYNGTMAGNSILITSRSEIQTITFDKIDNNLETLTLLHVLISEKRCRTFNNAPWRKTSNFPRQKSDFFLRLGK